MFPYLIILSATSAAALTSSRSRAFLIIGLIVFIIFVGFRFHIGVDWNNYIYHYQTISAQPVMNILQEPEPGIGIIHWFGRHVGGGIILVNVVSAVVFCCGLFAFAWRCREPFLALTIAAPYLVFVIAMSATRQAMALGLIFYLFSTWEKRGTVTRSLLVLLAMLFHFSAIFMLVFVALGSRFAAMTRIVVTSIMALATVLVIVFAPSRAGFYEAIYIGGTEFTAEGALPHVLLVAIPAAAYLLARHRWIMAFGRNPLLDALAIAAVLLVPFIYVSSVGADRMSLYFWPVAMYVGAGWPALISSPAARSGYRLGVIIASFVVAVGWFLLANSSWAYLPYKNYIWRPEGFGLIRR